jgi:hypothetical protein
VQNQELSRSFQNSALEIPKDLGSLADELAQANEVWDEGWSRQGRFRQNISRGKTESSLLEHVRVQIPLSLPHGISGLLQAKMHLSEGNSASLGSVQGHSL